MGHTGRNQGIHRAARIAAARRARLAARIEQLTFWRPPLGHSYRESRVVTTHVHEFIHWNSQGYGGVMQAAERSVQHVQLPSSLQATCQLGSLMPSHEIRLRVIHLTDWHAVLVPYRTFSSYEQHPNGGRPFGLPARIAALGSPPARPACMPSRGD